MGKPYETPIVNLNGTSKNELVEQQKEVYQAAKILLMALERATPHGRDYQTLSTEEPYRTARELNKFEWRVVNDIQQRALNLAIAIQNQGQ